MLPTLPAIAISDLKVARNANQIVLMREVPKYPHLCPNCGGMGSLWFQFSTGGPYMNVPSCRDKNVLTWDNGWYTVETRTYDCPICRDPRERQNYLWSTSGLPNDVRSWTLEYLKDKPGKDAGYKAALYIQSTIPNPQGWYLFQGGYGVGKTGILASLVASCIKAGCPAVYVRANDILTEVRDTYGEDNPLTEMDVQTRYGGIRLLAIDEIEKTSQTAWALSTLMSIFDTRYMRRGSVATVLATNLNPDNFPPALGYLASRLKDAESYILGGDEMRGFSYHPEKERPDIYG